ncbi:unnamed protein product [Cyprideis torosa]|uniref:Peptidase M14 domain-containing protein n=1 Tax=Cyprideis torosa TaxID=163714 RepID=A0A7R8W018_9CRUS|nr:unnamed protein product [Cyprideis torosa]CAG0879287.1 unnamed protein product [Cyprideis torosa]
MAVGIPLIEFFVIISNICKDDLNAEDEPILPISQCLLMKCLDTTSDDAPEKDVVIRVIPTNLIQLKHLQNLRFHDAGIENFLLKKSREYDYVDLIAFGKSYEGRDLWVLRINKPNSNGTAKKKDRLWRKSRSPNPGSNCVGTDLNRNWDYDFGGTGTSKTPCSSDYHGSRAFSEPETAAASQYISSLSPKPTIYLSLHSYSQLILLPFGNTYKHPPDYDELMNIARQGEVAIQRAGGGYWRSGTFSDLLYLASGESADWAKAKAGIKYSYTFELRDRGNYGFLLPPWQIIPAAKETWAGILAMLKTLSRNDT